MQGYNDTMIQWYNDTMVQGYNDTMIQWYNGTMIQWYNGTMIQWYNGTMIQRYNGTMIQWYNVTPNKIREKYFWTVKYCKKTNNEIWEILLLKNLFLWEYYTGFLTHSQG